MRLTFVRVKWYMILIVMLFLLTGVSQSQPIAWEHPDGTTHWYEAVAVPSGITWSTADHAATSAGGYLVTLTSQGENDFVFDHIENGAFWFERPNGILAGPWIGGFQPSGSPEPDGNWKWVTGEAFSFINWTEPTEPNNMNGNQDRIHFGEVMYQKVSTWDDLKGEDPHIRGYVIEYNEKPGTIRTVGLFINEAGSYEGYTLFAPIRYTTTYLINNEGLLVQSWESEYQPGNSVYLLENGHLLLTCNDRSPLFNGGGAGGIVQEFDWDGTILWAYAYSSGNYYRQHHDVEMLPNGNILMIAWELKIQIEAILAGRNPNMLFDGELWPDHIIEVEPDYVSGGGTVVWEWHLWDHLIQEYDPTKANFGVVADHPELVHINYVSGGAGADWNHTNAIDYNAAFDQIMISVRAFNEIWIIDHSTTTEEAAGHTGGNSGKGGDLLYRWGNPRTYQAGDASDQKLFGQHDARWIESGYPGEGNILIFNNGSGRLEGDYTTIEEIAPPVDEEGNYTYIPGLPYGPDETVWTYAGEIPENFYAMNISGAHRLTNGNTLICDGPHGTFFEVTTDGDTAWYYVNPVTGDGPLTQGSTIPSGSAGQENSVFRATRYGPDYPGFDGRDLTPGDPIEIYPAEEQAKGDVTNDGQINVLDALYVVQIILNVVEPSEEEIWRADCNGSMGSCDGDGSIDVLDVLKIVNLILMVDECP